MIQNPITTAANGRPARVLVVEDDRTSREFLCRALEKNGCEVASANSVSAAQWQLNERGFAWFDTVLTDYQMPDRNGLELLDWLRQKDATLAGIVLTGESEKKIVAESLRAGASDFLEKPVNLPNLFAALHKAVGDTHRQRRLAATESAVKKLARAQRELFNTSRVKVPGGEAVMDICFHPKIEAGGDFFTYFQPLPEKLCCLLTDVSGHDLEAAFISAYFQGLMRGMKQCRTPMPEIFKFFNSYLIEDWNRSAQFWLQTKNIETSVAALTVTVNFHEHTATVLACGTPAPIHVAADGRAKVLGEPGGAPLGWFADWQPRATVHSTAGGGTILMWTDGLEELAGRLDVHPLCVAHILEQAREKKSPAPLLGEAADDVLFSSVRLPENPAAAGFFRPLLLDEYSGAQVDDIDQLAARWQRHLLCAIPTLDETAQHDILLAAREAVLNAMKHGCNQRSEKKIRFQISALTEKNSVKIWVEDPGCGHHFDFAAHEKDAAEKALSEHRGLIFMLNLADAVSFERNGASVILEFELKPGLYEI